MPIIIKNIEGTRRASLISEVDAADLVAAGAAAQAPGYPGIYEEASHAEISQGYMTRSMVALQPSTKKRGRPAKQRQEIETEPSDEFI